MALRSCTNCKAGASPDLQLLYCATCQSALYCSKACQREDWKKHHKKICKLLNVGHGDMQLRTDTHARRSIELKKIFEASESSLDEDMNRFFRLFEESTEDGSRAAARKMRKIAKRQSKYNQRFLLFHSFYFLARSDSEKLRWPNCPLLVMLQFVDPNVLSEGGPTWEALLHDSADLADPFDILTHENQLILAKQLIEHGANVNAVSTSRGDTPLHKACHWANVTNLDFVELLLQKGADPNAEDPQGLTPLMCTAPDAPGAAKFLLNWPTTDANITTRSGASFLAKVRSTITEFSDKISLPDNPDQVQHRFLLQQWRGIEEMLEERGARDTEITAATQGNGLGANAWSSDTKNAVIFGGLAIICLFIRGFERSSTIRS
jgi:hypothetical protein